MRSGEYSILLLEAKDAAELAELEARVFSTAWSAGQYARLLAAVDKARGVASTATAPPADRAKASMFADDGRPLSFLVFGARPGGGALAGYASVGAQAGELEIFNIAVAGEARRQGLGRALLQHVLRCAANAGLETALLEVRESNAAALALYAEAGFAPCGRRKGYYADTGEDALVLSFALNRFAQT